ncbi:hypothetical protein J6590_027284 [Homalodisca vitripennis]|nr:hypothetical protein J6590_027284 [Homalodisca vitripennis]
MADGSRFYFWAGVNPPPLTPPPPHISQPDKWSVHSPPCDNCTVMISSGAIGIMCIVIPSIRRLVSDTVSDLTPGIWSQSRLKRYKEHRRRRS